MTGELLALALLLGQGCVAEIDIPRDAGECRNMWGVLARKAKQNPARLAKLVPHYNSLFKRRESGRMWILELDRGGSRPRKFPSKLRWYLPMQGKSYSRAAGWKRVLREADRFVKRMVARELVAGPCRRANRYGGTNCDPGDAAGACDPVPSCCHQLDCGGESTQGYYYCAPACLKREARPRGVMSARVASGR